MQFEQFIARRFMPRQGEAGGFSGPLTSIAVGGIALGVMVMVMAVSILEGFRQDITQKVVGFGSHLTLTAYQPAQTYTDEPLLLDSALLGRLAATPGVAHLQAFATKGGMVKTDEQIYGIVLRGYGDDWDTTFFARCLADGRLPREANDVLVSTTIAAKLHLHTGDKMRTYFWQGDTYRPRAFSVCGLYNTDLTEMDELYVVGRLATVQRLNDWLPSDSTARPPVGGYEVAVDDFRRLDEVAAGLSLLLPYDVMLTTVTQANPVLFSWLDLLNTNITLLLVIMALISAVCIVSALLIMIYEKSATIGLLKALGATNRSVRRIFMLRAVGLIARGIVIGDAASLALSMLQQRTHLLRLDPESYSMAVVPVQIDATTYLYVSVLAFVVCMLALLLPAMGIARISPAQTMRVEK